MPKKRYHSPMISETSNAAHLPQDVIVKEYNPRPGSEQNSYPDLFQGVEKALNEDNAAVSRNKKTSKMG